MVGSVRNLNVHEYMGQEIMTKYGIPVPSNAVATTPEEAVAAFESADVCGGAGKDIVVKSQILAGGRGLGTFTNGFKGGVHIASSKEQVRDYASKMIGQTLVTKQSGPDGKPVEKVLLSERLYLRRECYFSIMLDRASMGPILIGSAEGGTSIEDLAAESPEKIIKIPVDYLNGLTTAQAEEMATGLGFSGDQHAQCTDIVSKLYKMFVETDSTMLEINPFAETHDGKLMVCDAKINFDDNAEFRQKDIFSLRDTAQEDPREVDAAQYDLNYIGLDGSIGCMVNGAGLAMATMDIITLHGGKPANFLDVGGGATAGQVQKAFEILNADPKVKTIMVNIFGGIMRCDVIAEGIIGAAKELGMKKPIVVRLQGTNVDEARDMIANCGVKMLTANILDDAATKAVKIADIVTQAEEAKLGVSFELL